MNVGLALRNTPKGKIKYDKYWVQEGRTKEVLDDIASYSTNVSLRISPKILPSITSKLQDEAKEEKKDAPKIVSAEVSVTVAKKAVDVTDAYFHKLQSEVELPILEYEEERLKYIQDIFDSKKCEFDNYSWELQQQIKQEYLLLRRKNELDAKRRASELQKIEETILNEAREKEMLQQEQYQNHVKKLSAKVLEAELKQKKAEEVLRKREQEQVELRIQLSNCRQEAQNLVSKSLEKLNSCENSDHLRVSVNERATQLARIMLSINEFVEKAETKDLTIDDILNTNLLVKETYEMFQNIINDIENAKSFRTQEKLAHFSFKDTSSPQKNSINAGAENSLNGSIMKDMSVTKPNEVNETLLNDMDEDTDPDGKKTEVILEKKKVLSTFIAPDVIDEHHRIMENLKSVENRLQPIKADPKNKKLRFELQKLINVPINSLSSNSGSQIKTKINRLLSILSGKVPEVSKLNMNTESAAYCFCTNLMARQFVEQGDTQISAQFVTAFPIALAVIGVCTKKPDVWDLVLGHFYTKCPYLVPYYPPRKQGQTDAEYLGILGYHLDDDGKVEEKYKFLNRMSGFMRLYAAIIVSPLPPNGTTPHPHGLSYAWKWISRVLNLDPRPDVTATLLYDFLEVTGHSLQKVYGKQFKKMLHILCKEYFPKIKQVTPGGSGGPVERLETFLQKTVTKGCIPPPEGILESQFWNR